jgi:hypothetical protein
MKKIRMLVWAAFLVCSVAAAAAKEEVAPKPEQLRELNLKLLDRLSASLVDVDYFFKTDDRGELPDFTIGYRCPHCNEMHEGSVEDFIEERRPFRTPGYALAADEFIASDIAIHADYLDKLEVVFQGKRYPATIVAYYPERNCVRIRTATPVAGIAPLAFDPAAPGPRYSFFQVEESGVRLAAVAPFAAGKVIRELASGRDYLITLPNTLVVTEDGKVVALSMSERLPIGTKLETPPDRWPTIAAEAYEKERLDFTENLKRNLYPARIRLTPMKLNVNNRNYDGNENRNEIDAFALKLKDGRVLIPACLPPSETARLAQITLFDGEREIPARFAGSFRYFGALVAEPESPLPGDGIGLYAESASAQSGNQVYMAILKSYGRKIDIRVRLRQLTDFEVGFQGLASPQFDGRVKDGAPLLLAATGELIAAGLDVRSNERYTSKGSVPSLLLAELLADFDPANVPSASGEKIAWLGVEFQKIDAELARAHHAAEFTGDGEFGLMVSHVYPDSPAAKMGIEPGDILLSIAPRGSFKAETLGNRFRNDTPGQFPWERYDEIPQQYYDKIPPPWGTARNELNKLLGRIGIGTPVRLAVFADGKVDRHDFVIEAAPESFDLIEKFADPALGLNVCDLTYEVRNYLQLRPADGGVMVAKVRSGGPAAVAGIKPYEVIISVDGEPVADLAGFKKLIGGKSELRIGVRRLTVTRIVTIKPDGAKPTAAPPQP